jgi:predicted dehydrogenase
MKIKAGVAGTGSMGRNHARVYSMLENVELSAIYDQDLSRAQEVAAEFGCKAVSSLEELAEASQAVSVAVPTVVHREVGCTLMQLGCDVLMEKPIANSLDDAKSLIETSVSEDRILQVGHIERFNPVMRSLEQRLNKPKFIEAHRLSPFPNRSMDIGVVLDVMIHDLEIILHLVKSPVASIDAVGVKEGMQIMKYDVEIEKDEPLKLELAAFVDCAAKGETPAVTGQHGAEALSVALEITNLIAQANQA